MFVAYLFLSQVVCHGSRDDVDNYVLWMDLVEMSESFAFQERSAKSNLVDGSCVMGESRARL